MDHAVQISQRSVENEYSVINEENGILICRFKKGLNLNLEAARKCVEMRKDFSEGRSYPLLVDMRELESVSREAREYMADEGASLVTAGALLISSPVTRTIGNIFLMLNRPRVPGRLFNSKAAALAWLKEFTV
jgi:hypothetical protein